MKDLTRAIVLSQFQRNVAKKHKIKGVTLVWNIANKKNKKQGDLDEASKNHRFLNIFSRKLSVETGGCQRLLLRYRRNITVFYSLVVSVSHCHPDGRGSNPTLN